MPMTISLQDGEAASRKMREILMRHPEVVTVVSQHGRPDDGSDAAPFSNVELFVPLKPFDEWPKHLSKDKLTEQIQNEFRDELPGVTFNFSQYIQDNIEEAVSGVKGSNSVKIIGPNLETLTHLAEEVRDQMTEVRGVADLGIFPVLGQPNLNIKVDRDEGGTLWLELRRRQCGGAGGHGRRERRRRFWRATGSSIWWFATRPTTATASIKIRNIKVAYACRERRQRLHPFKSIGRHHA